LETAQDARQDKESPKSIWNISCGTLRPRYTGGMCARLLFCLASGFLAFATPAAETVSSPEAVHPLPLRLATFDVDATPPVGSRMAYDPVTNVWDLTLRARGIVLLGAGEPIV